MAQTKTQIAARIVKTEALLVELNAKLALASDGYEPQVGDVVRVRFGRAETTKELVGTVRAFGPAAKGIQVAVEVGEGLEARIVKVPGAAVLGLYVAEGEEVAGESAE